jgi:hypothetical protein
MGQPGWRSSLAVAAAAWFLITAMNLGVPADPVARALTDLGRAFLVGSAILSAALVDVGWAAEQLKRLGRVAAQPTT